MSGKKTWINFRGWSIPGMEYSEPTRFVASAWGWKKMTALAREGPCELRIAKNCAGMAWDLHHMEGRGLGGGKRDDRKVIPGCRPCHEVEEEKRRQGERVQN